MSLGALIQSNNDHSHLKTHKVIHYPNRLKRYKPLKMDKGINLRMLGKSPPRHLAIISGNSHRLSTSKDHLKMNKHKDSHNHMEFLTKVYMKKNTYYVPGSNSHTKSLLRHKPVIKFGNSHKTSTPQDQLKWSSTRSPA